MARPRLYRISLTKKERNLVRSAQKKTKSSTIRSRCSVLLAADEKRWKKVKSNSEIASQAGVCASTVISTLKMFSEGGVKKVLELGRNPKLLFTAVFISTFNTPALSGVKYCPKAPPCMSHCWYYFCDKSTNNRLTFLLV